MEELGALVETGSVAAVELAASALAARGSQPRSCPNCGKPLIGPYCAICGQPHNTHRRTLKHLLQELVKDIASFDSRILRTGRALLWRPGELPKAFREGRTQPYVPAIRLYLFVSLAFFLFLSATGMAFLQFAIHVRTTSLTHDQAGHVVDMVDGKPTILPGLKSDEKGNITRVDPKDTSVAIPQGKADGHTVNRTVATQPFFFRRLGLVQPKITPEIKATLADLKKEAMNQAGQANWFTRGVYAALAKLEYDPAALNAPLTTWVPRILFVLLPLFAALLALFYHRQRKEFLFVDHLVFSLTMHSFAFVVLIGAATLAQFLNGDWVAFLTFLTLSVYFLLSLKRFYGQGWARTVLKSAGVAFLYTVFFLIPALILAVIASAVEI